MLHIHKNQKHKYMHAIDTFFQRTNGLLVTNIHYMAGHFTLSEYKIAKEGKLISLNYLVIKGTILPKTSFSTTILGHIYLGHF